MNANVDLSAVRSLARSPDVREAVRKAADGVAALASSLAPVDDGELRDSIKAVPAKDMLGSYRVVWIWYGTMVEFGHEKVAPHPFARPAADAYRG